MLDTYAELDIIIKSDLLEKATRASEYMGYTLTQYIESLIFLDYRHFQTLYESGEHFNPCINRLDV